VKVPLKLVQSVAALRFPEALNHRLQSLMNKNNNVPLTNEEKEILEYLVELSETLSLLRAQAIRLLD
jgi:hypothetical protein